MCGSIHCDVTARMREKGKAGVTGGIMVSLHMGEHMAACLYKYLGWPAHMAVSYF